MLNFDISYANVGQNFNIWGVQATINVMSH